MSLQTSNQEAVRAATNDLRLLKAKYRDHVRRGKDSFAAMCVVEIIAAETDLAKLAGELSDASEADSYTYLEAKWAAKLLKMMPATKEGMGMPKTKEQLWPYVIAGMSMGSADTEKHARLLLKPRRLSADEKAALKRCFQRTLESHGELWPPSLIVALHCITRQSEPCATRCIMHAVARYTTDEQLMRLYS